MRFLAFEADGRKGVAVANPQGDFFGLSSDDPAWPGDLDDLLAAGGEVLQQAGQRLLAGRRVDIETVKVLPPVSRAPKIICLGLNYAAHAKEGGFAVPDYPTLFGRFNSSLVGHGQPVIRPKVSDKFDFEGELVFVVGKAGRHISREAALEHVAGYSIFNDVSVRDYQLKTPQWTIGKNFDGTGAFGPYLVTPDELPAGASGLRLQTRLNGQVMQEAKTDDLIFDVARVIELLSEALTLEVGDVVLMGTPSGIGHARTPPVYMKPGDVCEVEIEGLGVLSNTVADEK
ncbi:5-oxopent-3-ene-1,2,5-tricarboxylate decarboxylase [Pseudomonas sp. NBRC 100443]|nr:fumarylacetoacetate hydrolase family protein [Pseudomonas sp. NBRC 100443]GLU37347.1 5-oxopent-3-ene-1,2,5-tricarboxylate decarboxylase [Pseudomonas sp. NBRC 100443]